MGLVLKIITYTLAHVCSIQPKSLTQYFDGMANPITDAILNCHIFFFEEMCHLAAHKTCCVVETICYIPTFTNIGIKQLKFIVKLLLNFVMEAQNNSFHMGLFNSVAF